MSHTCSVVAWNGFLGWYSPGLWDWALKHDGKVCGLDAIGSDFIDDTEVFMCATHYTEWFKNGYRKKIMEDE